MTLTRKQVIIIEGPDGAGKSTVAAIAKDWALAQTMKSGKPARVHSTHILYDSPQVESHIINVLKHSTAKLLSPTPPKDYIKPAMLFAQQRFWLQGLKARLDKSDVVILDRGFLSYSIYNCRTDGEVAAFEQFVRGATSKLHGKVGFTQLLVTAGKKPVAIANGDVFESDHEIQINAAMDYAQCTGLSASAWGHQWVNFKTIENPVSATGKRLLTMASLTNRVKKALDDI